MQSQSLSASRYFEGSNKDRGRRVDRRRLCVVLVSALALLTAACGSGDSGSSEGDTTGKGTVIVYGSTSMEDLLAGSIADRMSSEDISIKHDPLLSSTALTKSIAERRSPKASLVLVDTVSYLKGASAGLWDTIDVEAAPAVESVPAGTGLDAFENRGVAVYGLTLALMYREDLLKKHDIPFPTSFADLADPRLKGHVGIPAVTSSSGIYTLVALAHANGGDESNIDPGFAQVKELKDSGQLGPIMESTSDMNEALQRGDVWVAVQGSHGALSFASSNEDVGWTYPTEGMPVDFFLAAIPKDAPNKVGAEKLINELLSSESQSDIAKEIYGLPVIEDAKNADIVPGEEELERGRVSFGSLMTATGSQLMDWTAVNSQINEWYKRWTSTVLSD